MSKVSKSLKRMHVKVASPSSGGVPVFTKSGQLLGHVSKSSTSIGASKVAKGSVQYARHDVHGWGWRKE